MSNYFPAQTKVSPSYTEPGLIVTYVQPSGAFAALSEGKPRVKIGSEHLVVYMNRLDLRTNVAVSQSPENLLPSASLALDYYQTSTYLLRVRAVWDHHDMNAAAHYAVGLPGALDLAMRQGIFLQMRTGLLYGFNPQFGEGLLNTTGATAVTLPPDTYGNTTTPTYDNGQLALFFLNQIVSLKSRMYQSGGNIKNRIVVISPQRVFLYMSMAAIVQVTSYQRPGGGTSAAAAVVQDMSRANGDIFEWYFDDTLIGQGAGGADAVLLTMPEIEAPELPNINTNTFGSDFQPQIQNVNVMYADMAAPMKIPTPTPDGAITEIQELRCSSGWCIRPQGITIVSMPY